MFPRRSTALAAAITFVLVACGGGSDAEPAAAPSPSEVPSEMSTTLPSEASTTVSSEVSTEASATQDTANATGSTTPEPGPAATAPSGATEAAGTPAPDPAPEPTAAGVAVPAALDFTATTIDGSEIELGQFAGRPVLLWFWAPW